MAIEAVRSLSLPAAHAFDKQDPARWNWRCTERCSGRRQQRVVGIDSYDRTLPLGDLLADALVLPLFEAGTWALGDGSCTS